MKKFVSLLAAVCLTVTGATIGGSAADLNSNVFCYGHEKEVIIADTDISRDKMQLIADYVADELHNTSDDGISTCGIACLFGHNLKVTHATETHHNEYSTSPKCRVNEYTVTYCTRSSCDYIDKELTDSYRTGMCHG